METKRIGFGKRLFALILDTIVIITLVFFLSPVIAGLVGLGAAGAAGGELASGIMGMFAGLATFLLVLPLMGLLVNLLEGLTGATPGKIILGIKVANADGSAGNITLFLTRYVIKNIAYILGGIGSLAGLTQLGTIGNYLGLLILVGCFFALGQKKLALHDIIAKTAVYKRSDIS